jgi:hypothetical protein
LSNHAAWAFVDDQEQEAAAFVTRLSRGGESVHVKAIGPSSARDRVLGGEFKFSGILMDVDLSAASGERGTGLGIAQDIRAAQKMGTVGEMPIVRFARHDRVAARVGGDPTSDDLFDLLIDKSEVYKDCGSVQRRLRGARCVYERLSGVDFRDVRAFETFLGLDAEGLQQWSHPAFHARMADGLQTAVHVAAGAFMRTFLQVPGLLIDRALLHFRLGLDPEQTGVGIRKILESCETFKYKGVACHAFERWWARGLDDWWLDLSTGNSPLAALTISERVEALQKRFGIRKLRPLAMPQGSAGDRPWRVCSLSLEEDPPRQVPVDPSVAIRFIPRVDLPPWADPTYAALGPALRARDDMRLDRSDLDRLIPIRLNIDTCPVSMPD